MTKPVATTLPATQQLHEGKQVEAKYRGGDKFYPGRIARANSDGTYDIAYDDGDSENGVKFEQLRPVLGMPASETEVIERVFAMDQERWQAYEDARARIALPITAWWPCTKMLCVAFVLS